MVRKVLTFTICFLGCLLIINDVQAMQPQRKKIIILQTGNDMRQSAQTALAHFIAAFDPSVDIVSVDPFHARRAEIREQLDNCYAVLYCQSPDNKMAQALLALIVRNNEPLRNANGRYQHGLPVLNANDYRVAEKGNRDIDDTIEIFGYTARYLRNLLAAIPDDRKAFLNLWLRNDDAQMGDALRGGHAVELCPITATMGGHALDLWYRTQEARLENNEWHQHDIEPTISGSLNEGDNFVLSDLCRGFADWLRPALQKEPIHVGDGSHQSAEQNQNVSSTQVKAQEQQPPHDPVLLKKQQPKPTGAKKHRMINLPHLVPAVLPAGGQPQGIFSRFMSGVKNLFWPHIDLPTLDRQRQIRRADLHDALKTEIDTHLAEEGRIGKPYLRRLMSICIPLSVAGSSAMIACTKRLKDSNPTLAISINILTMLAMCQIALHLKHTQDDRIAIFMDHLDAIKDTHLVNQAVAARLKARYAHENWAGRWLANSKIDDMKAEPAAAK